LKSFDDAQHLKRVFDQAAARQPAHCSNSNSKQQQQQQQQQQRKIKMRVVQ
jgi:hypothetical protein